MKERNEIVFKVLYVTAEVVYYILFKFYDETSCNFIISWENIENKNDYETKYKYFWVRF